MNGKDKNEMKWKRIKNRMEWKIIESEIIELDGMLKIVMEWNRIE